MRSPWKDRYASADTSKDADRIIATSVPGRIRLPKKTSGTESTGIGSQPWIIVAGGFHELGGMDKANAALARYLLERNAPVHLVAHRVADEFWHSQATIHLIKRPLNSFLLGEAALELAAKRLARRIKSEFPHTVVIANGGNYTSPDVDWVHSVHHAWPSVLHEGTPAWFRGKQWVTKRRDCRRERRAITRSRLVITNSERTRQDVIQYLHVDPRHVVTLHLGADPSWNEVSPAERINARRWLKVDPNRKLIAFVGALGHDQNKGLDILWSAWVDLCSTGSWDVDLVIAGGGRGVSAWQDRVNANGARGRVRVLGFTDRVRDVLAASDLLVSPVHYEAFGLNVHEAVCRGVPAIVTSSAGIAELYPQDCSSMLLSPPPNSVELRERLLAWRKEPQLWQSRFKHFGAQLRQNSWRDMARDFVNLAEDISWTVDNYQPHTSHLMQFERGANK
jgi:glycosyltransferase involved in cell wall biosynthesis